MDITDLSWEEESPWEDNVKSVQDSEWNKLSSGFQNAGYREGITAGKESHLQQGFDEGFAQTGAPLGREIGLLRGAISALLSLLTSQMPLPIPDIDDKRDSLTLEAREISYELNRIRFSDIAPPDLEAEQHAREHIQAVNEDDRDVDVVVNEENGKKREMESLEDAMARMGAGSISTEARQGRPTPEDVVKLTSRLNVLSEKLGLPSIAPVSH